MKIFLTNGGFIDTAKGVSCDIFWTMEMLCDPLITPFTVGLANVLALETLRHGTDYTSYLSIRRRGFDPACSSKGASKIMAGYIKDSKGYVFVLQDLTSYYPWYLSIPIEWLQLFVVKIYNGYAAFNPRSCSLTNAVKISLNVLLVPPINCYYRREQTRQIFEVDKMSGDMPILAAYRTKQVIATNHIGLQGILLQGFGGDILQRMKKNWPQVMRGVLQIAAASFVGFLAFKKFF
jgi:hypothetical protein